MGGKETKVAPKDWPTGHDVDRSSTQYKLTPQMAYKNIFFSPKNRSKCKYRGKSPQRPDLDVFGLPENESGIHLSPKNLDKAVAKLSILRVQHCSTSLLSFALIGLLSGIPDAPQITASSPTASNYMWTR